MSTEFEPSRVSFVVWGNLEKNLRAYARISNLGMSSVIRSALYWYLKEKGLDPDKEPKFNATVTY